MNIEYKGFTIKYNEQREKFTINDRSFDYYDTPLDAKKHIDKIIKKFFGSKGIEVIAFNEYAKTFKRKGVVKNITTDGHAMVCYRDNINYPTKELLKQNVIVLTGEMYDEHNQKVVEEMKDIIKEMSEIKIKLENKQKELYTLDKHLIEMNNI